jgi:hypothetical protein
VNLVPVAALDPMTEGFFTSPKMTTTETRRYRGYDIVPKRQWSSWCVGVYPTRADLPLMSRSTLRTLAPRKEDAVAEAKQSIDRILSSLDNWRT